jgi:GH15 family glucan-1,4-alpha-glucosidase
MYRKISDYGLIGDLRSAALVSNDGSIDYCSLPWLDSPTVFASLLDDEKGGFFSIQPEGRFSATQQYVVNTNILASTFTTHQGSAVLHDLMPMEHTRIPSHPRGIHRCMKVLDGSMSFILALVPRPDNALVIPSISRQGNRFTVTGGSTTLTLLLSIRNFTVHGNHDGELHLSFTLEKGEEAHINLLIGPWNHEEPPVCPFDTTKQYWNEWLQYCLGERCTWLGEFSGMINRSLLTLKLLTFQPTGAIAAAATTSLPEAIGAERNWDYRFTWLRDASFTLKALFTLGHVTEADSFIHWLHATYRKYGSRKLQIMYSLHGESSLQEKTLPHLKGYRNSRPVRIGNDAHRQNQWDIYGEVMDAALRLSDYAGKIDEDLWPFFRDICMLAMENWKKPDDGIWEVRNGPYHFVYSKVMCWVALDRGITIARRFGFDAPLSKWIRERDIIRNDILSRGYRSDLNSFVQRYESDDLDASLLLLPLVSFLPVTDKRIQGTIEACRKHLMHKGFLRRYKTEDGLEGEEGGFVLCNFWLIECLALSGEIAASRKLLEETMAAANHLGLFSEEYDSSRQEMLGNFPQAFSHIGYINAVSAMLSGRVPSENADTESSLMQRLQKLIPLQLTLNKPPVTAAKITASGIDTELKKLLGRLQGAFFNVREGRVNYQTMKKSESFRQYINLARTLDGFDPATLKSDEEKKAFWINIYNILIIHGVIEFDIRRSVLEIVNFFGRIGYSIGGNFYTPDHIEHGILRKNRPHPVYSLRPFSSSDPRRQYTVQTFDPRIHFALVCASNSCPPIEFYDAEHIDRQLDIAARSFINRRGFELDRQKKAVYLSRIFLWYEDDFGAGRHEMIDYILQFTDVEVRSYVSGNFASLRIRYLPYNWNLNRIID